MIDFDTGTRYRDYSQLILGLLELPTAEPITLVASADDGLRLFIDDRTVIDGWTVHGERTGSIHGAVGERVELRIEHFQNGGPAKLRLEWEWKGQERELVPASALWHSSRHEQRVREIATGAVPAVTYPNRGSIYGGPDSSKPRDSTPVPDASTMGPILFLDEHFVAGSSGLSRVLTPPVRDTTIPNPIVSGREDRCVQPYLTVLQEPETGRFRMWYGAWRNDRSEIRTHLAILESHDGVRFERPHRICDTPEIQFGSEVIDRGPGYSDPSTRYVYSYWLGGGTRILASPDGYSWRPLVEGVVLPHDHDITGISWDEWLETYVATISSYTTGDRWSGRRRSTMMSTSDDLVHWSRPWFVLTADDSIDEGDTQFYGMDGYLTRGSLRIGMPKILRDDLQAAGTAEGSFGRAHTALAWSRDGKSWIRDPGKFFEPDDALGAWDHAHAWIDEQVIVGEEVYLYYSGYKSGHKADRFEGRQIGLVKMKLDRYVARRAEGDTPGLLTTTPFRVDSPSLGVVVNADAGSGELVVRVLDADTGEAIPGFGFDECRAIRTDDVRIPVRWRGAELSSLAGRTVRLEFRLVKADLFAFQLAAES